MSNILDSTRDTRLCVDCKGLRLDDEACGGFIGTSDKGTPTLRYNKESVIGRIPGGLDLLMCQQRTDSSPAFPTLAQSAAAGCGFCGFLCAAILRANIKTLERQGQVSIRLGYALGLRRWVGSTEERLQALVAEVYGSYSERLGSIHFGIYTSHGTYR
jgi:hypothetical protein